MRSTFAAFLRTPSGPLGLAVVFLVLAVALIAPELLAKRAETLDVLQASQKPSVNHLLGTDPLGRDLMTRVLAATRLTVGLALTSVIIAAALGYVLGIGAALAQPRVRTVVMRAIDGAQAFPAILVAIFVGAVVGPGPFGATLGVAIAMSSSFARVSSTMALSIAGRDFFAAAQVLGLSRSRIMLRYVLPNIAETLITQSSSAISSSVVFISSLSFLGLGVQRPDFDWGSMLTEGVRSIYANPAAALGPAMAIAVASLGFGYSGEAFARSLNPLLWTRARGRATQPQGARSLVGLPRFDLELGEFGQMQVRNDSEGAGAALRVDELVVSFPGPDGRIRVVDGISFSIAAGEMVGVVGESGSGKTMAAMAIARLVPYPGMVSGHVSIEGRVLAELSERELRRILGTDVAVVFQDPMSALNPALTIGTQMTEATETHRAISHREALMRAADKLSELAIPAAETQLQRYPHELSGGMRQRVTIAMGLMGELALLIADEPTTALDVTVQAQIMDLLAKINREDGAAIMLISHNIGLISQNCTRVFVMYSGRIVESGPTYEVMARPLHPYTVALIASVPSVGRSRETPLDFIAGQLPDPAQRPTGCAYHPRCPLVIERCRVETPPLVQRQDGTSVACWVANRDIT